jgi:hypothetical protein
LSVRPIADGDGWLDWACELAGVLLLLSVAFDPDWLGVALDEFEGVVD